MDQWLKRTLKNPVQIDENIASNKKQKVTIRKYSPKYPSFGCHWTEDQEQPRIICVVCLTTLSNEIMNPSKLQTMCGKKAVLLLAYKKSFRKQGGLIVTSIEKCCFQNIYQTI